MVQSQTVTKGGLRPLLKWARFIFYLIILVLLYHTLTQLSSSHNTRPESNQYQDETISEINKVKVDHAVDTSSNAPLYHDFPWYKTAHPRIALIGNISTSHLTSSERQQLQLSLMDQARAKAKETFAATLFTMQRLHRQQRQEEEQEEVCNIPGSTLQSCQQVQQLRTSINQWTKGQWIATTEQQPLVRHVQDALYGTCDKRFYKKHSALTPRPATQYQWQTANGVVLPTPMPPDWCRVLNGRHILLVGDLVQYQLHELFLDSLRDGPTVCFGELNCKDHTICAEPDTRLRYLRNDILSSNRRHENNNGSPSGSVITWPFIASNILKAYPIIVLNRSPIVEDDETFISSLIQTLTAIRKTTPDTLIIYRSSPIGHPYCDDADRPLTKPLTDDEKKRLPFGWTELERRNEIARVIVEEAGGVYVDLAALVETRPDGHVGGHDCLRYCIPGPLDTWMNILYQVFASLEGYK